MTRMCEVLGVSTSGYYAWRAREASPRAQANALLQTRIKEVYEQSRQVYGARRVYHALKAQGVQTSQKRVTRLMRIKGWQGRHKRKKVRTTTPADHLPTVPNHLKQEFTAQAPDQIWTGDITYIETQEGWLYLAVVLDVFSRKIVGWAMSADLTHAFVLRAFQMAWQQRQPAPGLLFHSDRGSQYAAHIYRAYLETRGVRRSMSRTGNCYDNAITESFFGRLKTEWVAHKQYATRHEARTDLFEYIEVFYNRSRLHSALGYLSPVQFEMQFTSGLN